MDDADHAARLTDFQIEQRLAAIRRQNAEAPAQTTAGVRACCDCHDPIEAERLRASPAARRCFFCQAAAERSQRTHRTGAAA